jgi:hypothetical protein
LRKKIVILGFGIAAIAPLLGACGNNAEPPTAEENLNTAKAEAALKLNEELRTASPEDRRQKLREQAKADPDAADAAAIEQMSEKEILATAINSAGYLCARVTEMHPSNGSILVFCTEYRNGSGRVRYRIDPQAGTVEPL